MSGETETSMNLVERLIPKLVGRCRGENFPFQRMQDGQPFCYVRKYVMTNLKDSGVVCPYADLENNVMAAGDYHCVCRGKKK